MEKASVHFDMKAMEKAVPKFVRARAIKAGSYVVYKEKGRIIKENPRTGKKSIIPSKTPGIQ